MTDTTKKEPCLPTCACAYCRERDRRAQSAGTLWCMSTPLRESLAPEKKKGGFWKQIGKALAELAGQVLYQGPK